jgi:hypothetical protein
MPLLLCRHFHFGFLMPLIIAAAFMPCCFLRHALPPPLPPPFAADALLMPFHAAMPIYARLMLMPPPLRHDTLTPRYCFRALLR